MGCKKKVLCAMSGGVDSSVAVAILKSQGYEVIGVTMKTWAKSEKSAEKSCCGIEDIDDARRVAMKFEIPWMALEMEDIFKDTVINNFVSEYKKGRTPNPCIVCNYKLKFGYLMQKADEIGADFVATGHYARIFFENGRYMLKKGVSQDKDQSYVLYNLNQEQLSRTIFPLGEYEKPKIRQMAKELGLSRVATKPDSQEICFVDGNYRDYLKNIQEIREDENALFVDHKGKTIGNCGSVAMYTIGQRKGLGISLPQKMYVTKIDAQKKQVFLGTKEQLLSTSMIVVHLNWVSMEPCLEFDAYVKIRYNQEAVPVRAIYRDSILEVSFQVPQESVSPGQSAVFYDKDRVLVGGLIRESGK